MGRSMPTSGAESAVHQPQATSTGIRQTKSIRIGWTIPLLAGTLLAAFALRIWLLGAQNIWWDEGLAIWAARQGWARMTLWTASDVHPPIYFWLLKAWVSLAGESEFAARFISLACAMVTVAATYPLGRILLGKRVAALATVLLAFSRFHVWWSQEMRMYIVATMWGVLSLYTLLRWLRAEGWLWSERGARHRAPLVEAAFYVATTAAGLYTLYLFVTIILIENLFVLYLLFSLRRKGRPRFLPRWVLAQLVTLALFVPWLVLAFTHMRSWSVATPFDFTVFLRLYATLLTLGISTYIERYTWLVAPFFAIIALAGAWVGTRLRREVRGSAHSQGEGLPTDDAWELPGGEGSGTRIASMALLLGLFLVVPSLVVYVLTRPRALFYAPRVEARYLILFAPAFMLLLAWSLALLRRWMRWLGLLALIFVAVVFLWTLPAHYAGRYLRDEYQTMVRIIAAYAEPGDAVVLVSGSRYAIFDYYYGRLPDGPVRPPEYYLPQRAPQVTAETVESELAPLVVEHPRLWLAQVGALLEDPQGLVAKWLDDRYGQALSFGFAADALTLYAPGGTLARMDPANLLPQYPLDSIPGSGLAVRGYDLPTGQFRPGDMVRLALYYAAPDSTPVTVRLVDSRGRVLDEHERSLPAADPVGRAQFDFPIYAATPGGLYHFEVHEFASAPRALSFGQLRIENTTALPKADQPPNIVAARFEGEIELVGYALTSGTGQAVSTVRPGQTLTLDLYWRAGRKIPHNYTVFVHLVGQAFNPATAGPVWGGHDSEPLQGGYPTSQWLVDEVIVDRHMFTLDGQAPAGEYEVEVGMYLLQTMKRLFAVDSQGRAADRIVVTWLPTVQP